MIEDVPDFEGCYDISCYTGRLDVQSGAFNGKFTGESVEFTWPEGKWVPDNFQLAMSSDGSCIRMVSVPSDVDLYSHPDSTNSLGFLFRVQPANSVAPAILPGEHIFWKRKSLENIVPMLRFGKFRGVFDPPTLFYSIYVDSLGSVQTADQQFYAKLQIILEWPATQEEYINYVMNPKGWTPWAPPELICLNMQDKDSVSMQLGKLSIESGDNMCKVRKAHRHYTMIKQTIQVIGNFHEDLELENYPFDVQPFSVHLGFVDLPDYVKMEKRDLQYSSSIGLDSSSWKFVSMGVKDQNSIIQITTVMERQSTVTVVRVIMVLMILQMMSLGGFTVDPIDGLADRLGLSFTMMLTAVAYSLVIQSFLPEIGYLTFLDKYVMGSFIHLATVSLAMAVASLYKEFEDVDVGFIDRLCLISTASLTLLYNLAAASYIAYQRLANEHRKKTLTSNSKEPVPELPAVALPAFTKPRHGPKSEAEPLLSK